MKQVLLFTFIALFSLSIFAQHRAVVPKNLRNKAMLMAKPVKDVAHYSSNAIIPGEKSINTLSEAEIGQTIYDLQTNTSTQNRLYLYGDGTIGGVWTMGFDQPGFSLRGTGYNYFDGSAWGAAPTVRIENEKTGWPSYAPYGENGELFVNHTNADGLWIGTRDQKGTGDWSSSILAGPTGVEDISWPRAVSSGVNHNVIQTLCVTYQPYDNQDYAILYSRSDDGGATWNPENMSFDELGPDYYTTFAGDIYDWAEPQGDQIAFLLGESWTDLILMKSADGGDNWDKTLVWENPYPLWNGTPTDTFYCADGSHHLAFDNSGKVHVVFGINRAVADDAGSQFWFPLVGGIVYWNEDMPTFSNGLNALNPYGDPASELIEDYNLIGWSQDIDGSGELDILGEVGTYYIGLSSMAQIAIDDQNEIFVVYSSVTEGYNNGLQDYRHLWARTSPDGGTSWGAFHHLNEDIAYIFDECIVPSISPTTDDNIYILYQADNEPGLAVRGDLDPYGDNAMRFMTIPKVDIIEGINEKSAISQKSVSQNYPNPVNGQTMVSVVLDHSAMLSLQVSNLMGQVVYQLPAKKYAAGKNDLTINASALESGVYFYTVTSGENSITKKMIVE